MELLAGIYGPADIVQGTIVGAVISLLFYVPLQFTRDLVKFQKVEWYLFWLSFIYLVISLVSASSCPHYWELALPAFAGLALLINGITLWLRQKKLWGVPLGLIAIGGLMATTLPRIIIKALEILI